MKYDPNLVVPAEVMQAVQTVRRFAAQHDTGDDWQIGGIGPTHHLQRQLADAIRERDQYKAACEMATALRPLGAVQVVEGGGAVLLDTSGRKA